MSYNNRNSRDDKSDSGRGRKKFDSDGDKPGRKFDKDAKSNRSFGDRNSDKPGNSRDFKPRGSRFDNNKPDFRDRSARSEGGERRERSNFSDRGSRNDNPRSFSRGDRGGRPERNFDRNDRQDKQRGFKAAGSKTGITRSKNAPDFDGERKSFDHEDRRPFRFRDEASNKRARRGDGERNSTETKRKQPINDDLIRLNRYIANSGICSRRKADELIEAGVIKVNGEVVTELGHKVDPYKDEVRYNGEVLKREKKIYVLLNKPKDYITTTDDPQERRTVMQLVDKASKERIYPVGRLDRNTTGLLLMTNDGELADRLSHPRNSVTKIYHAELNRNLTQGDFNKIEFGLELEDGFIKPDSISYVAGASKREVGIQIHSGKNRIVRRIFEHLGYEVVKLDRVVYGNLTKKDLPRGRWRYLEEHELIQIKHFVK